MRRTLQVVGLSLACLAATGLHQSAAQSANSAPSAMIVFDGSGSMWGKIDGEKLTKLVLARDALKSALGKVKSTAAFGLMSFGHRRQGDCSDIQLIQSPEQFPLEKIMPALEKLNPKGRGPLTAALKEAAKGLGQGNGPRSLIVIHDDLDNCQQDTCQALSEVQAAAPGVAIHLIGLGLKSDDARKLSCLATQTKGTFVDAQSADQVIEGIEEAVRLAALATSQQPARTPTTAAAVPQPVPAVRPSAQPPSDEPQKPSQPAEAPLPRVPLNTVGPPGLRLAALLAPGAPPPRRPVGWSVRQDGPVGAQVFSGTGQDLTVPLPAGKYFVEAQDGMIIARQTVTVAARGTTAADLVLNAGILRLTSPSRMAAMKPVLSGATITLFEAKPGANAGALGRPLGVLSTRDADTLIPAGVYVARIEQGPMRIDRPLAIVAGSTEVLGLQDSVGRLLVSVTGSDTAQGAPPVIVSIAEDDPDAPRGRREFARSAAPDPDFIVASGTYYIAAQQGSIEARERLTVGVGETVQRTLSLASARLSLASRLRGQATAPAESVSYRIERIDTIPPEVYFAEQSSATLSVPAGRYRIEARHGQVNARASQEVELKAGERRDVVIEHEAGTLLLRLAPAPGAAAQDVFWDVRDQSGRPVWTAVQAEPRVTLQAGRYLLRADTKDRRIERILDVKSGDNAVVELKE